jgi:transitional endoplasmic reticulum ATPase
VSKIIEHTDGYVGADIESLVREAAMLALRENIQNNEVRMKHFEEAMKKVGASVTKSDIDKYRRIESEYLKSAKSALEKPVEYFG